MEPLRDSPGSIGQAAGFDGMSKGRCHGDRLFGAGDRGVEQDSITPQFHGEHGVGSRTHAGVDQHGDVDFLPDDTKIMGIANAHSTANGRTEGHDRRTSHGFELSAQYGVVVGVGHDDKAVVDESACR